MTGRLERAVADLMHAELERFAEWCAKNWTISPEIFKSDSIFDTKPEGYREGYNAALEGLAMALEQYLES